jgi:hypothetical protein
MLSENIAAARFLDYRNKRVIKRYVKEHSIDEATAEKIFCEMLKFLYICTKLPSSCSPPSREIDDMWHSFILHTPDYFAFCGTYVGRFLHHDPTEEPYIGNRAEMLEIAIREFGALDVKLWKHLLNGEKREDCDGGNCTNYCSESCSGGGCTNKIFFRDPAAGARYDLNKALGAQVSV